jgi:signal transduction histidine kinase
VTAYRIVEEALGAVLRQDAVASARVAVRYRPRELELEICDEAVGARAEADRDAGAMGLRERVALFGGELHAGRRRGGGWAVQARLPIEVAP